MEGIQPLYILAIALDSSVVKNLQNIGGAWPADPKLQGKTRLEDNLPAFRNHLVENSLNVDPASPLTANILARYGVRDAVNQDGSS
jgi:hypothetical protein